MMKIDDVDESVVCGEKKNVCLNFMILLLIFVYFFCENYFRLLFNFGSFIYSF